MATNPKPQEDLDLEVKDRELATLSELDLTTLDPNFQYRWVNRSPKKVARSKARGYIIVDPAHEEGIKNLVGESPEAADGTYTIGDVILMKLPIRNARAREHAKKRRTDKRLQGPKRRFRRTAQEKGLQRGQKIEVITTKDPQKED